MSCDEEDPELAGLNAAGDADELCRLLLTSGWFSSRQPAEAVDLLRRVDGDGELGTAILAMLLCTCSRWRRVSGKLVAAIESDGLLSGAELAELAEAFLAEQLAIEYRLAWLSSERLEIDLDASTPPQRVVVDERKTDVALRRIPPPLRRWAACRALNADPARLDELLSVAERRDPRARAALMLGLLDAGAAITVPERRRLAEVGLQTSMGSARRAALNVVCELDGPDVALRRARSDPDAGVRAWRPRTEGQLPALTLL